MKCLSGIWNAVKEPRSGRIGNSIWIFTVLLTAYAGSFWISSLKIVDPLHHSLFFYSGHWLRTGSLFALSALLLICLGKTLGLKGNGGSLLCAGGAVLMTVLSSFTALAAGLVLWSSAIWLCFDTGNREFSSRKLWLVVPCVLFAALFASGLEQQISAYDRLILLYQDWGIYFSAYRSLAEAPFENWIRFLSAGNHFNPSVNVLMSLVLKLFPGVLTVFVVNSLVLTSVIPLVFILGRTLKLPLSLCALCSAAAAFAPMLANQHTALTYGYHPVVFLLPAFLLFCIAKEKKCLWGMIASGIFMAGIKETVFVFAFGFVILLALQKKWRKATLLGVTLPCAFFLIISVVLPFCDGNVNYFQLFQYKSLGGSTSELLLSPFAAPLVFLGKLFRMGNLSFVLLLLLPFLPAVWGAPRFLLAALPVLLGVLLKDCYLDKHNIVQQYGIEITAFLLAALVYGTAEMFRKKQITAGFIGALLAGSIAGYYFVGKTPVWGTYSAEAVRKSPDVRMIREQLKKIIPQDSSVALSAKWGAQLTESHKKLIFDISSDKADFKIIDFTDKSCDMKQLMQCRDTMLETGSYHPVRFLNLRGCQIVVFRKGQKKWDMPFIVSKSPEALLPKSPWIPLNVKEIRCKALYLAPQRKILLFLGTVRNFSKDAVLKVTLASGAQRQHYSLRWGYGIVPAYKMNENQCFAVELPLPRFWNGVDGLQISADFFDRPDVKE